MSAQKKKLLLLWLYCRNGGRMYCGKYFQGDECIPSYIMHASGNHRCHCKPFNRNFSTLVYLQTDHHGRSLVERFGGLEHGERGSASLLFAFRCPLEAANLPIFSLYCRLSKSFKFSTRQWQWGIDLGVTWVCVHDLTWHQNDLKEQNYLFRVLSSVLRNKIVRDFGI